MELRISVTSPDSGLRMSRKKDVEKKKKRMSRLWRDLCAQFGPEAGSCRWQGTLCREAAKDKAGTM